MIPRPCPRPRELCSFSHPAAVQEGATARSFKNLKELRKALEVQGLHFCSVCLEGRKVSSAPRILPVRAQVPSMIVRDRKPLARSARILCASLTLSALSQILHNGEVPVHALRAMGRCRDSGH